MDNKFLLEEYTLKQAFLPVDLDAAGATGARISLAKGKRVAIILTLGDSVGASAIFTLKQHNAAVGGTTKDLSVANIYFKKAGTATSFTKVEPTVAAAAYDLSADFAAQEGMVVFEVLAEDLDVNGGFSHVSVDVADSGAVVSKLAAGIYVLRDMSYAPAYSEVV